MSLLNYEMDPNTKNLKLKLDNIIRKYNKKFSYELIACFPFNVIWVFDTTSRKKTLIRMRNKVNKAI
jgi:hypothetical protein